MINESIFTSFLQSAAFDVFVFNRQQALMERVTSGLALTNYPPCVYSVRKHLKKNLSICHFFFNSFLKQLMMFFFSRSNCSYFPSLIVNNTILVTTNLSEQTIMSVMTIVLLLQLSRLSSRVSCGQMPLIPPMPGFRSRYVRRNLSQALVYHGIVQSATCIPSIHCSLLIQLKLHSHSK